MNPAVLEKGTHTNTAEGIDGAVYKRAELLLLVRPLLRAAKISIPDTRRPMEMENGKACRSSRGPKYTTWPPRPLPFWLGRLSWLLYVSVDIDSAPHDWFRDICGHRDPARPSVPLLPGALSTSRVIQDRRPCERQHGAQCDAEPSEQVIYHEQHSRGPSDSLARVQQRSSRAYIIGGGRSRNE